MIRHLIFAPIHFFVRFFKKRFVPLSISKEMYFQLKEILGFFPDHTEYYQLAFVHRSATYSYSDGTVHNNERLEYLGDAILGAVVADMLFHKFPNADEGFLTQMRSRIVNREHMNALSREIGLDRFVVSNTSTISSKKNIYGDALEAFIGAIYLDKGYKIVENFIVNRIIKDFVDLNKLETTDLNFKSQVIEWGQKNKYDIIFDTEIENDDTKFFTCSVKMGDKIIGKGRGKSKKEAEQRAAEMALAKIDPDTPELF